MQARAKEVADGTESHDRIGRTNFPRGRNFVLFFEPQNLWHVAQAYHWQFSFLDIFFPMVNTKASHLPLHIRLTATNPNVAQQHVVKSNFFLSVADVNLVRATCFRCFHFRLPFTIFVRRNSIDFVVPSSHDAYFPTRNASAPNHRFSFSLQDHVVFKRTRDR